MGLDNIPKPHPCELQGTIKRTKDGRIDCQKVIDEGNCEFATTENPIGIFGAFCWFRGKALVRELEAIGYTDTQFMYEEMTPKKLAEKAEELEKFLSQFKQIHEAGKKKVIGAGCNGKYDNKTGIVWQRYSNYNEIIDIIEKGIKWLKRLSELGCGAKPWY